MDKEKTIDETLEYWRGFKDGYMKAIEEQKQIVERLMHNMINPEPKIIHFDNEEKKKQKFIKRFKEEK